MTWPYSFKNEIWPLFDPSGPAHSWHRDHHMNIYETALTIDHSDQVSSKSALTVCEKKIFWDLKLLFHGGHLGFADDLHFNKNEQTSPTDHYREIWPISAKRFTRRRRLKSLIKERPFDLSAAILDDVITWFRQKMIQSDRLVDTFDLIYDMTIFGQIWNLTPTRPRPFLT